jgi:hypothetical protein
MDWNSAVQELATDKLQSPIQIGEGQLIHKTPTDAPAVQTELF